MCIWLHGVKLKLRIVINKAVTTRLTYIIVLVLYLDRELKCSWVLLIRPFRC